MAPAAVVAPLHLARLVPQDSLDSLEMTVNLEDQETLVLMLRLHLSLLLLLSRARHVNNPRMDSLAHQDHLVHLDSLETQELLDLAVVLESPVVSALLLTANALL